MERRRRNKDSKPVGVSKSTKIIKTELQNRGKSMNELMQATEEDPPLYPPLNSYVPNFKPCDQTRALLGVQNHLEKLQRTSLYHVILSSFKTNQDSKQSGKYML